jgi:hypothetical protein
MQHLNKTMKYIILLGVLISFSGSNLIAQSTVDNLKPKMKLSKEVLYKVENGELKSRTSLFESNLNSYTIYDKNEKPIEFGQYETDGSIYEKTFHERNDKGDALKAMQKNSSDEVKSYWTYEYDSDNNMIEVKTYDSENSLTKIQSNKSDENGNSIEMVLKNSESDIGWKYVYKYNSDNKKIEQLRYEPDGSLLDRRTYNYNEKGNEFEQFQHKPDGTIMKFVSEYDEMGNLTIQNWFNEQKEQTHQTSFEYVYDKNGNWITKRRSSKGVLSLVWEREIEYYE